ncbi:pyridoxal 5'-phosphate synthase [Actinokineospora fastidiosa]|uniref:pyridoxal 5'-phosphate synthase n=1 Tax=Actinokineospora fastidiosa TaxID=1816 RepID=UPI001E3F4110|nr:pyridoxal 5'-phosphate synthase [Actinokineospora fastidiosa]
MTTWYENPAANPCDLLREWLAVPGLADPGALALATAGTDARPSSRIVQLLRVTDSGVVFASFSDSPKGRDIAATGWASGVLYWRENRRQVTLAGAAAIMPAAESDALWAARPDHVLPMSVATRQSAPLTDADSLRARVRALADGERPARPATWVGYHITLSTIEFWEDQPDRFYRRLRYDRGADGWTTTRLQP